MHIFDTFKERAVLKAADPRNPSWIKSVNLMDPVQVHLTYLQFKSDNKI